VFFFEAYNFCELLDEISFFDNQQAPARIEPKMEFCRFATTVKGQKEVINAIRPFWKHRDESLAYLSGLYELWTAHRALALGLE
jgi:hypothetical protein